MRLLGKLSWFFKQEKYRYSVGILALVLVSIFNLIPPRVMGDVIDRIDLKQMTTQELFLQMFYLVGAGVAMYLLRFVWRRYIFGTANKLARLLRFRLFRHFTQMSPAFYQEYRTGDLMAHATNDINALTMFAGGGVMSAVDASITALVTLVTMFVVIDWRLTLIAIFPLPFMTIATSYIGRKNHASFKAAQEAFSSLNNHVQESVSGVKVTKSFGYQADETTSFAKTNQMVYEKNMVSATYNSLYDPSTLLFVGMSFVLTLFVGGQMMMAGELTAGEMVSFMTYLNMLVWPLQAIGFLFNVSQRASVSYDRIETLLAVEPVIVDPQEPLPGIQNGDLRYDVDRFAYDDQEVLTDIHFQLKKGQTLGIVGPTGSGKTTLLRLLLRERDVPAGAIQLDGEDIRRYRLSDLRGLMGYVPQDQILFAMSIRDNIRFANPELDQEDIEHAAKVCGVYDDIVRMAEGFDTLIGERGVSLSGGQKQRIAMSRALAMDPDILMLDDSLSAVDAKTEHYIIDHLKAERSGKTTIITAHRLSAIVHADLILVMDQGRIRERGTHEELMAQKGWYYETYQSQQLTESLQESLEGGNHEETES